MPAPQPRLSLRDIHKRFQNIVALKGVDLDVREGEIVGLIGENGAGKSTLAKIVGGIHRPDAGQILVEGDPVLIDSVQRAQSLGISVVHQELNLVPHLSVEDNVLLGREPFRVPVIKLADRRELRRRALETLEYVGLRINPATPVMELSIAQRQRVEIAKALSLNARLLIMDEPTSSLAASEASALLEILATLSAQGISILYISHKLDEVLRISDRIVVFRDGEKVAEKIAGETSHDELVTAMVGRELSAMFPERADERGEVVLSVRDLLARGLREPISFDVRAGEVLGLAGLVGAGRSELLRAIFGVATRTSGVVSLPGTPGLAPHPFAAMQAGIGMVPEDRKADGLILPLSIGDNIVLAVLRRLARLLFRRRSEEAALADQYIQRLAIQVSSREQPVDKLSGGNQQKTLLAKWLAIEPRVLLLDEPTRGIDVGAKHEVYRLIAGVAAAGVGVVMASSEMEEIIGLCDRALVMNEGRLAGELTREDLTEDSIMRLAAHNRQADAA